MCPNDDSLLHSNNPSTGIVNDAVVATLKSVNPINSTDKSVITDATMETTNATMKITDATMETTDATMETTDATMETTDAAVKTTTASASDASEVTMETTDLIKAANVTGDGNTADVDPGEMVSTLFVYSNKLVQLKYL